VKDQGGGTKSYFRFGGFLVGGAGSLAVLCGEEPYAR
jgi:hypothetical protein